MYDLSVFWYCIILVAIIGYAVLDGFDLGVGILHLFTRQDYERRVFLNAIGPIWDGNAVWLVVVFGGMLAGFPAAYATLLSAFYTPTMVFLFGIILRAVAIEFRSKRPGTFWRNSWDLLFSLGSLIIAFGVGLILGNLIEGIAIDQQQVYRGELSDFFSPYSVLIGLFAIATFTMHGGLFLVLKTEGELQEKLKRWVTPSVIFFFITYFLATVSTLIYQPQMVVPFQLEPWLFLFPLFSMLVIANIPREVAHNHVGWAFISSCVGIAGLILLYGIGVFPTIIRSSIDPAYSITISNGGASLKTFEVLTTIVLIGLPLVLLYFYILYRTFRGKVVLDTHSY